MNIKKNILNVVMAIALLAYSIPVSVNATEADYSNLIVSPAEKPSEGGALQILEKSGQKTICDQSGKSIQLRGMCTHGLQWFPGTINNNAFAALSNDWGSNVIRLAMYVTENGYNNDPIGMKEKVIKGVDFAIANNMYVIVDWHMITPGDPNAAEYSAAKAFFEEISSLYPNNPNIIYELCNEPNGEAPGVTADANGWIKVKNYAEPIIKMLRDKGNKNLVIVGSPYWSHRTDLAADNPVIDSADNTAYAAHFSAGSDYPTTDDTDRRKVMTSIKYALNHGVAVFVSEWTLAEAGGMIESGGLYYDYADNWLDFFSKNNISWCAWSICNNNYTSSSLVPYEMCKTNETSLDPGDDQLWSPNEISPAGEYYRARIKGITYNPIDRKKVDFTTNLFDFDDDTTQGFGINRDSFVKSVMLSNENKALKLNGLSASNDISDYNFWGNARLSAEASGLYKDIKDAENLTMDVITATPATVSIAVVPQSYYHSWIDPKNAVQVVPEDFKLQQDGSYKATLTISSEDSPNLKAIASDSKDSILTDIVLIVGSTTSAISIDNIAVSGTHTIVDQPIVHSPIGTPTIPSDFEDSTRNGWDWDKNSGVKGSLTIEEANNSKAMSWYVQYPKVKPSDLWTASPHIRLIKAKATPVANNYLTFDLYLNPISASKGSILIYLVTESPELGYWAMASEKYNIPLTNLNQVEKTTDGLYHYKVNFDLRKIDGDKVILPNTNLDPLTLVFYDVNCDFDGKMYIDNIKFSNDITQ
ncbi:carbohydrate-binding domain-containing protein [Clostridium cellulovorans]|uniref:cellulase n=2 Tax=Clostridium cellulovorans TaxID=1493 RepID=D9ST59_CLOC7|nr:carbohydrate-binding domain-containing protein [Clostridium cellulovorans]ADL50675.1 Cellulase [Clostridium cellulovorans 743B]BAV13064.1 endoglucanase [Clostridium cellulovorans]